MCQDRAFRHAGRATGVLQERDIVAVHVHRIELQRPAGRDDLVEGQRARQLPGRHHLLDATDHEVRDLSFREAEHVADARHDDAPDLCSGDDLLKRRAGVLEDHDDRRAGISQLMLEFAPRVERIDIDDRAAGAQRADDRDRVLQDIRHHQGDAIALPEPRLPLQPRGEAPRQLVEFAVAERPAHVGDRRPRCIIAAGILEHLLQRAQRIRIDLARHARRIIPAPECRVTHCCVAKAATAAARDCS